MIKENKISKFVDFSRYKSILCLDGDLPEKDFFSNISLKIIAADGAANLLNEIGIVPDFIIGDFDSVFPDLLEKIPNLKNEDQSRSDFQKALEYIKGKNIIPPVICGINGGYLDHILNNINIFLEIEALFIDKNMVGIVISGNNIFSFSINTKISILGIPECVVSSNGLKWELDSSKLTFPGNNSCFNRVASENININVIVGKALLLVYINEIKDAGSL